MRVHPFQWITDLDEKIPIRIFVEKQLRQLGIDLHHRDLTGHLYPSVLGVAMNNLSRLELAGLLPRIGLVHVLGKGDFRLGLCRRIQLKIRIQPGLARLNQPGEHLVEYTAVEPHSGVFPAHEKPVVLHPIRLRLAKRADLLLKRIDLLLQGNCGRGKLECLERRIIPERPAIEQHVEALGQALANGILGTALQRRERFRWQLGCNKPGGRVWLCGHALGQVARFQNVFLLKIRLPSSAIHLPV